MTLAGGTGAMRLPPAPGTLGDRLLAARMLRGYSMRDLAHATGYSTAQVAKVEHNTSPCSPAYLDAVCRALGITREDSDELHDLNGSVPPDIEGAIRAMRGQWAKLRELLAQGEKTA